MAQKVLKLLLEKSGKEPGQARVMFGPSIRACHYEVGPEFKGHFPASSLRYVGNGRDRSLRFDLPKENRRQLIEAGVPAGNITDFGICTVAENRDFYSFRKEKDSAGRIISFIVK